MNSALHLPRRFKQARLDLELLSDPLTRGRGGTEQIVQIDITRPPVRPPERFRLFPGAPDNRIEVLEANAVRQQLVLFVEEARRSFQVTVARGTTLPKDARVVREDKYRRVVEQFTQGRKRHFLCGMDEQHLFIAELPHGVSSVHGAREALRAPEVPPSHKNRRGTIIRQGEWFFLPTSARQQSTLDAAVRAGCTKRHIGIAQAAALPRAGRPHVADEVVVLGGEIFVRGEVRHPDHRTVTLREFHYTVPNRERFTQPEGVYWVD